MDWNFKSDLFHVCTSAAAQQWFVTRVFGFYARCTWSRARYCYREMSVRLFVRPSACNDVS